MTHTAPLLHGGRIDMARRMFPAAPQPWIDLSTGVNPQAFPVPPIAPEAWTRLPDSEAFAQLEDSAASAYRAPDGLAVVAGAGTQAFIQTLPRLIGAKRVAALGFTYAEHPESWRSAGADVTQVDTLDALGSFDVAIVVNPNNPDGRLVPPQDLAELAQCLAAHGGVLIVDEAFMDMLPEYSLVPMAPVNAIILRSFGKAYGLPGARLGFALSADTTIIAGLRAVLGPWCVNGPALAIGAAALADAQWLQTSALELDRSVARLDALLQSAGFTLVGGTKLFRLFSHVDAAGWFQRFGECGILVRRFPERDGWLRFGLPHGAHAWARLAFALGGRS